MSKESSLRIVNDILKFNRNKPEDIYISFNKSNFKTLYALIIGPRNTPYCGGFFFFKIDFPDNYPKTSPRVKFLTTDGRVRFNPNLYASGKVCLSILGTWSGPAWTEVMTLSSVLLSLQSLLCSQPIKNEPGWEMIKETDERSICYNIYLIYCTYKISILDVLTNKFKYSDMFKDEISINLKKNYDTLHQDLLSYKEIYGKYMLLNTIFGSYNKELNFIKLENEFKKVNKN